MACSKCVNSTFGDKCLAAISAASLQTLAISAPTKTVKNYCTQYEKMQFNLKE